MLFSISRKWKYIFGNTMCKNILENTFFVELFATAQTEKIIFSFIASY